MSDPYPYPAPYPGYLAPFDVIESPWIPEGVMYIAPSPVWGIGVRVWEEAPEEIEDVAVDIVQAGLADIVAWLRAAGHDIPTWQERRDSRERRRQWTFRAETRMELSVFPRNSVVKITNI